MSEDNFDHLLDEFRKEVQAGSQFFYSMLGIQFVASQNDLVLSKFREVRYSGIRVLARFSWHSSSPWAGFSIKVRNTTSTDLCNTRSICTLEGRFGGEEAQPESQRRSMAG